MKKDLNIIFIRIISMGLIVSCHIFQGMGNRFAFWLNVGVQIFFFISGFLYGNKDINNIADFYKKRAKKILLPFSLLVFIMLIIEKIFLQKTYLNIMIFAEIFGFGSFYGNISTLSHTWFISYILICYLITPLLQSIFSNENNKKNIINLILISIFLISIYIFDVVNINPMWIINYILGYFYSRCCLKDKEKRNYKIFIFTSFLIFFPLNVIYQEKINIDLPSIVDQYKSLISNFGHVMLGIVLFFILYKLFEKMNIKENIFMKFLNKYSFYIYLVHQIFILNAFSLLEITDNLWLNILIIITLSILSALLLKFIETVILKLIDIIKKVYFKYFKK